LDPCFINSTTKNTTTSPCQNNGRCVADSNRCGFKCECSASFTGNLCQVRKDPCETNPCKAGFCTPTTDNDYTCKCPCEYYWGKNCQYYNSSCLKRANECQNGGTCFPLGCEIGCTCSKFYTGNNCELQADPCSYNTCLNG
jgi:hypothetical protein